MSLANVPLFRGADPADVAAIEALAEHKDLLSGDRLFSPGETPGALYLILSGSIVLRAKDKEVAVTTLGSGQLVGEGAFFGGGAHPYSATAAEITRLAVFPNDKVTRVLAERPKLALIVYRNAAHTFAEILRRMAPMLDHPYA